MNRFIACFILIANVLIMHLLTPTVAAGRIDGDVYLSSTAGLVGGKIPIGAEITFTFNYHNADPVNKATGIANGFELSATGGVTWSGTYAMHPSFPTSNFDLVWSMLPYSWDGVGADTVLPSGAVIIGSGLPPSFDGPAVVLTVQIDLNQGFIGETFCIDSVNRIDFNNSWLWVYGGQGGVWPSWDGPHCFEIADSGCCNSDGIRGDADNDCTFGCVTVADLSYMVDFLFNNGPAPVCEDEANADGDCTFGCLTVADLSYLVDFLFNNGPAPGPCP